MEYGLIKATPNGGYYGILFLRNREPVDR